MAERYVALYAIPLVGGGWFRFIGDTETVRLPMRPFWLECMTFEYWEGTEKAETLALCRKHGVDVLILIHVARNARGKLLREILKRKEPAYASAPE